MKEIRWLLVLAFAFFIAFFSSLLIHHNSLWPTILIWIACVPPTYMLVSGQWDLGLIVGWGAVSLSIGGSGVGWILYIHHNYWPLTSWGGFIFTLICIFLRIYWEIETD